MFNKKAIEELMKKTSQQQSQMEEMQKLMLEAQSDPDVIEAVKAMKNTQGLQGMTDISDIMKQMQGFQGIPGMNDALKQMQPGMDEAMKQMQGAQAMIADQIKQAMEQHGKTAVKRGNTEAPAGKAKSVTSADVSKGNTMFTALATGLKWVSDTHVEFGSYPQTKVGDVRKILWRVLEKNNSELFLISEYILDNMKYQNDLDTSVKYSGAKEDIIKARLPWERCDLRAWLNSYFYDNAFNAQEKSLIIERLSAGNGAYTHASYKPKRCNNINLSILKDDTYEKYEDYGCGDTRDRVFLLNVKEALDYFKKESYVVDKTVWNANRDRDAKATDFALERGKNKLNDGSYSYSLNPFDCWTWGKVGGKIEKITVGEELRGSVGWWLRNIGVNDISMNAMQTSYHGSQVSNVRLGAIFSGGTVPYAMNFGVRPAIIIKNQL